MTPINALPEDDKVTVDLGTGKSEIFSKNYLLEIEAGKFIDDVVVTSITPRGLPVHTRLDHDVWTKSLLPGPWKNEFLPIWNKAMEITVTATDSLNSLRNVYPTLHNNSKVLLRDMKLFGSSSESRQRLLSTQSQFCLGEPYFSASAIGDILKLPAVNSTLDEALNGILERKKQRGEDEEICAAHDLAPCFERAFGIDWATVRKEKNLTLQKTDKQPLKWKETKIGTLRKAFGKILPFQPEK
ncbi:hypothetical protein I7I48_04843 [Histoplasma ohiense]|nr:hypothetical protein I7I48_04843 [Histoplasma ohiense (nom. inval.)]